MPRELIETALAEHSEAVAKVALMSPLIEACADRLVDTMRKGGKVLVCGNGGSAADAQHLACELTGRFEVERRGYPAIALSTDTSALTAIGNDYGFDSVFARQVEALGQAGDMLIAISTSGNSVNVLRAVETARSRGLFVVGLLGREGGAIAGHSDIALTVGVSRTARIQEAHVLILHLICTLFDHQI